MTRFACKLRWGTGGRRRARTRAKHGKQASSDLRFLAYLNTSDVGARCWARMKEESGSLGLAAGKPVLHVHDPNRPLGPTETYPAETVHFSMQRPVQPKPASRSVTASSLNAIAEPSLALSLR